jgi:hypothetical protein
MKVFIDFEFNRVTERKVNLVCCSLQVDNQKPEEYWLHPRRSNGKSLDHVHSKLASRLDKLREQGAIFVAYSVEAEARSFIALGLEPMDFKWYDLYLEWAMITNHNHKMAYGKQYIDGKLRTTRPPNKWDETEDNSKPGKGLASACYKLTGEILDTEHKTEMRNLIISDPLTFSKEEQKLIQDYCTSDIKHLPKMLDAITAELQRLLPSKQYQYLVEELLLRGQYAALTAHRTTNGYPINYEWTCNFADHVDDIIGEVAQEINEHHPKVKAFTHIKEKKYWKKNDKLIREWVAQYCFENRISNWKKSKKTGEFSLETKQWEKFFHFSHDYPLDNFGAQMVRYYRLKKSLNGFVEAKTVKVAKRKKFWDSYDPIDNVVRPFMGIYGAQSSRSQPGATGFIPLKAAWMRALIAPPPGEFMGSWDYKAEEFFIRAIESGDKNMQAAYLSGDAYMWTAINDGFAPQGATKDSHPFERSVFKIVALALQYGMTKYGLAIELTQKLKRHFSEEEAQAFIDRYYALYLDNHRYTNEVIWDYKTDDYIKLPCGWYMFGDNPNDRSTINCPGQGLGGSAMRCADIMAWKAGLQIPYTLHDALYLRGKHENRIDEMETLADCMIDGFAKQFRTQDQPLARKIMLDGDLWGPEFDDKISYIESRGGWTIKQQQIYIDDRAQSEYEKFSKYFRQVKPWRLL